MMRLNILLLLAVLASALLLVHTQYDSRLLYTELDRMQGETRRLELEHERLQVEKRAQATPLRVETLARAQLHMRTATPAITQYVADAPLAVPPPGGRATPAAATGEARP
ncbi:MAG: cell division protein FtsL [Simplicispira sp.]|nr:cell division protein FtsL [Simplicispira sp.]